MRITVKRFADNGKTTLGAVYIDGIFQCFSVEDTERDVKIKHHTRVPEGIYTVSLRTEGGYHKKYSSRYGTKFHKGMLAIWNEDNYVLENNGLKFQYILIHTGNTNAHTSGCLLLNNSVDSNRFVGSSSRDAYKNFYPKVADYLLQGGEVTIEYLDIEEGK